MAQRSPTSLDVLLVGGAQAGWGPIASMARSASTALGGTLIESEPSSNLGRARKLRLLAPRRRSGGRRLLMIAPLPGSLDALVNDPSLRGRYDQVFAWVIDSFWHERIPRIARSGWIDRFYVMDPDDVEAWSAATCRPVAALPWGADVLGASDPDERDLDLLRVGRQPEAWDDDRATAELAASHGLAFAGRPPFGDDEAQSQRLLHEQLHRSHAVLAFSNRLSPAPYTHPTREYLTGRWTDALAHGCVMVGGVPRCTAADDLVPGFARLDVPADDPRAAMAMIAEARADWTPELAQRIRAHARAELDWHHRFAVVAADLGITAPALETALASLQGD